MGLDTNPIRLRRLQRDDCDVIAAAFAAQGWDKPQAQYLGYLAQQETGTRDVIVAEWQDRFAGYVTVEWTSGYPPFADGEIPEIVDFNVLIAYQRRGIGTALMDRAEALIQTRSATAGLGVCLHHNYGPAQVLYARRGYIPDGRGVHDGNHYPSYGEKVVIGDDLVLYMTKRLT